MGRKARRRALELELTTTRQELAGRHTFTGGYLGHDAEYRVNVNEQTALAIDAVYACVRLLADAVAGASWGEWRGTDRLPDSRLVRRPMVGMTRRAWAWRVTATLALYNVCHLERVGEDSEGVAMSLVPIAPGAYYRVGGRAFVGSREVDPANVRTIRRAWWPSVTDELGTVIRLAQDTLAAAWAADAYTSDFWQNGGAPLIVLTSDQDVSNDDAAKWSTRWADQRRKSPGKPAVLGKGLKADRLGVDAATDGAGAADDRLMAKVARYFGMPAWLVNVASAAGSLTYSNTESAGLDLVRYTLGGYLGPIEDELSDELPADYITGRRVVLDVSHLTHGTMLERAQAMAIATGNAPWMRVAEARTAFNLPPDSSLDARGAPAAELIPAQESAP